MLALGIVLLILGLVMLRQGLVYGVLAIGLGVYIIYDVNKKNKQKAEERRQEALKAQPPQRPVQQDGTFVEFRRTQPSGELQTKPRDELTRKETIRAAGISYRTDAVLSLGVENDEYTYNKKQIIEEGLEDEKLWEYHFPPYDVEFVFEPDNEYDPNAIAIYVEGEQIGYVERELTSHVRDLIESGKLKSAYCQIVGGKYKIYDSVEESIERDEINFGARIILNIL